MEDEEEAVEPFLHASRQMEPPAVPMDPKGPDFRAVLIHGPTPMIPMLEIARLKAKGKEGNGEVVDAEAAVAVRLEKTLLTTLAIGAMTFPMLTSGTMRSTPDLWLTPRYETDE